MERMARSFLFLVFIMFFAAAGIWAGGGKDLKGKDIIIGNFWENYDVNTWKPSDENEEAVLEWRKRIQKDNGMVIKERMVADWGNMLQTITSSVMAGRPAAQAFHVEPGWAMALRRQGLLAAMNDSRAVDLTTSTSIAYTQVAYNQDIAKIFTFNGKQYALTVGYGGSRHSVGIFFNKRLFREAGLDADLPYNMQRDGTWNWENFLDLCKKLTRDRNNTGRIDTYAMNIDMPVEALIFSNGAEYIGRDTSGKFINASGSPQFLEALNYFRRLMGEDVLMQRPDGSAWDWHFTAFHDGQIAMIFYPEWMCGSLATMSDDWGYVLPPKGPRASDYRFPTDENVIIIPSTYKDEDLDLVLTAINLWYIPTNDDWKSGLWSYYRDTRAVEETMTMIRGPRYGAFRNHMMIPGLETGDIDWQIRWWDGDPAQLIESVSPNWNALVADANNIK